MPIRMDISAINRLVVIVSRGHVTADEIRETTEKLVAANVPGYTKIIDVSGSSSDLTREQVEKIAALLRGDPADTRRGGGRLRDRSQPQGLRGRLRRSDQGRTADPALREPPRGAQAAARRRRACRRRRATGRRAGNHWATRAAVTSRGM